MELTGIATLVAVAMTICTVVLAVGLVRERRFRAELRTALGLRNGSPEATEARLRALVDAAATSQRQRDASGAELAALLATLDLGVIRLDRNAVVTAANPAAHALLGRPAEAMVGRPLLAAVIDPRIERLGLAPWSELPGSALLDLAGGGDVLVIAARAPGDGRWLFLRDVSELVRLRRIRAEFVDNLSHELRTPVTTIGILAESLAMEADGATPLPDRVRDRIAKIEVETGHLAQMVGELLDLARVEQGEGIALTDDLDLVALATAAAERLRPFAEQAKVELALESGASAPLLVRGDPDRLGQAVVNLVHNAIKFSEPGGRVTVAIGAGPAHGEVHVSVRDEGIGIAPKDQGRLFERFYKVDRARSRGGGTGLGLSIVRHIVEAHGGRVEVVSALGSGSTFTIALPGTTPAA